MALLGDSAKGVQPNDGQGARVSVFDRLSEKEVDPKLKFVANKGSTMNFAAAVGKDGQSDGKLEFFPLADKTKSVVQIPIELTERSSVAFRTTVCGYFLGARLQFAVVKRFAQNAWGKYGFVDAMVNANGMFFFKFNDLGGATQVAETGFVMIQGTPFFLQPWDPTKGLHKPEHSSCPLWVKLLNVPLVVFNKEGISRIASALGVPKQMDACTTSMCDKSWGRPGFAKVLVDVWAVGELKREVEIVIPSLNGGQETKVTIKVEYLWEPVQCDHCLVFGHKRHNCVKAPVDNKLKKKVIIDDDGFQRVQKKWWRPKVGQDPQTSASTSRSTSPVEVTVSKDDQVLEHETLQGDKEQQEQEQGWMPDHVQLDNTSLASPSPAEPVDKPVEEHIELEGSQEGSKGTSPTKELLDSVTVSGDKNQTEMESVLSSATGSLGGKSVSQPTPVPIITEVVNAMHEKPLKSILKPSRFPNPVASTIPSGGRGMGKPSVGVSSLRPGGPNEKRVHQSSNTSGCFGMCNIVESKVLDVNLGNVCSQVFHNWNWISNVNFTDTGARIILAWDVKKLDIMAVEIHAQFIHCLIRIRGVNEPFYATFVYGANTMGDRRALWSGLRKAKVLMASQPWIVLGDFNAMLFPHDGYGGSSRRNLDMEEFYLCMEDVELIDVQYSGIQYTWCQKPSGGDGIVRKLDRVLSNVDFTSRFSDASVKFLPRGVSDHAPGLLSFGGNIKHPAIGFRFDNFLTKHPSFVRVVSDIWLQPAFGSFMHQLVTRLKRLKTPLRRLRSSYGDLAKRVKNLKVELDAVQLALDLDPGNKECQEDLAHLLLAYQHSKMDEESFFRQRAKVQWLSEGDMNTKFFHNCVKEKRGRNFIHSILDQHGQLRVDDAVGVTFVDHFAQILGTSDIAVNPVIPNSLFSNTLSLSDSLDIIRPITDEDIKSALFGIGNDKAPGSDGFTSKFFKASWEIIGTDVLVAVHNFFYSGRLLTELNHTLLCLIPKKPNASMVGDYRPISCCSVLYKCISKVICERIKPVLDRLVGKSQSAFIPGRRILDNILMAHELKHSGPPRCAFKIDIRKAYDMVDWKYITTILGQFGFHPVLVGWIKEMLHTTSFSVAINGGTVGFFKGARGLRQGDPISPYLFTLVMEGFAMALRHCILQAGSTFGYHHGCAPLEISHLCFADDLFVFTRGDVGSVEVLKRALDLFQTWSGLAPSLEKSEVFFGNVPDDVRTAILHSLPFRPGVFPIRYLGVPLSPVILKVADFAGLITKVKMRIHNWKAKFLSFAGRKLLISSVLQSLNLYWMSVFILPSGVIHELESVFRNFLWAHGDSARGKCKLAWEDVCKPISNGGLGLRKLATWNRAMVAKHLWDLFTSRDTYWVDWVRVNYSQGVNLWRMIPRLHWSWVFRKLLDLRPMLRRFIFSSIGNGGSTNAWADNWLACGALMDRIPFRRFSNMGFTLDSNVSQIVFGCNGAWPNSWVERCQELALCPIPILDTYSQDVVRWRRLDGSLQDFQVKEAYEDFMGSGDTLGWATAVWFKGCIPKHAFCVWVACHRRLPTQDRLTWKHDPPDLICPLCNVCMDSHDHLFFLCDFSLEVWRTLKRDSNLFGFSEKWDDIRHDLTVGRGPRRLEQKLTLQASVYCIWRERNRRLFGHTPKLVIHVVKEIRDVVLMRMAWKSFDGDMSIT
ncbi:hypothetical protein OSB04_023992 [Centaurea solstitialis]|uniref:Reverse transcriptase domain-containing protein n=1 Tax=Centaurea solstitialis TaxID=347529 RepID=A0AA38SXM4_9ASTR|nr:hypothetical protein OSB04_023992 [Centaurea solstitialis]